MGSSMPGMTKCAPRLLRIPRVKVRYLNTKRIPRLAVTAATMGGRQERPARLQASTHRPKP